MPSGEVHLVSVSPLSADFHPHFDDACSSSVIDRCECMSHAGLLSTFLMCSKETAQDKFSFAPFAASVPPRAIYTHLEECLRTVQLLSFTGFYAQWTPQSPPIQFPLGR